MQPQETTKEMATWHSTLKSNDYTDDTAKKQFKRLYQFQIRVKETCRARIRFVDVEQNLEADTPVEQPEDSEKQMEASMDPNRSQPTAGSTRARGRHKDNANKTISAISKGVGSQVSLLRGSAGNTVAIFLCNLNVLLICYYLLFLFMLVRPPRGFWCTIT
jgi:hypothetical protein